MNTTATNSTAGAGSTNAANSNAASANASNSNSANNANANSSSSGNHYPIASLYVGDLAPDVTEAILFEKFSTAGPVLSIRVCRDIITRRSLGYAYVNYQNSADAERAIDTLNFERLAGKPIRIMWSQRDPSLRRSGLGNIFIKNLEKSVDNKIMFDTFSVFGNILSCKVSYDDKAQSKGYGFVHFDAEEAATKAIAIMNGKFIEGKKVFVGKFVSRKDRDSGTGPGSRRFTNVYVKNLADEVTDDKLRDMFAVYGSISSAIVVKSDEGKSKCFGFVCFGKPDGAEAAVKALNGNDIFKNGKPLYVGRAQKKAEREAELKRKLEAIKAERINRSQGVNLYVKNLEDSVNDERLQKEFSAYGTITSAKVMVDDKGSSKGFGFVCFSTPEEATKAVTEMNNRIIVSKPLYVALAQRKEDREAQKLNMRYGTTGPVPGMRLPQGLAQAQGLVQQQGMVSQQFGPGGPGVGPMQGMGPGGMHGQAMVPGMHPNQHYLVPIAPNPGMPGRYYPNAGPGAPQVGPGGPQGPQPGIRVGNQGRSWQVGGGGQGGRQGGQGGPGGNMNYNPNFVRSNPRGGMPGGPGGPQPGGPGGVPVNVARQGGGGVPQGGPQVIIPGAGAPPNTPGGRQFVQAGGVGPGGAPIPAGAGPQGVPRGGPRGGPNVGGPGGVGRQGPKVPGGPGPVHGAQAFQPGPQSMEPVSHEDQMQILGERLYPQVNNFNPENAGKITGMLLEMDVNEIVHMLDSPDLLKAKVEEALAVLQAHRAREVGPGGVAVAGN